MKKDFSILEERHIKELEDWLRADEEDRDGLCPIRDCPICSKLLPRTIRHADCPCFVYTMKYLTRVAEQAIKYLKEKYND